MQLGRAGQGARELLDEHELLLDDDNDELELLELDDKPLDDELLDGAEPDDDDEEELVGGEELDDELLGPDVEDEEELDELLGSKELLEFDDEELGMIVTPITQPCGFVGQESSDATI